MREANGDAEASFEHGTELAIDGEYAPAPGACRRADEAGHATAAAYRGILLEAQGEQAEAEQCYRRADERGDGYGAFKVGLLLAHRGDWSQASEAGKRADGRTYEHPPFDARRLIYGDSGAAALAGAAAPEQHRSPFANPALIGSLMVLLALVAVFLAYNANRGLPFVPTKELRVEFANGSN